MFRDLSCDSRGPQSGCKLIFRDVFPPLIEGQALGRHDVEKVQDSVLFIVWGIVWGVIYSKQPIRNVHAALHDGPPHASSKCEEEP